LNGYGLFGKSYLQYMEYAGVPANIDLPSPYLVSRIIVILSTDSKRILAAIIQNISFI